MPTEKPRRRRRPPTPPTELHPDGKSGWISVWSSTEGVFRRARVDAAMLARVEAHRWRLDRHGYPLTTVYDIALKKATHLFLHRMVTNAMKGVVIDHKRGNKLDARRCMLRPATYCQNSANRRGSRRGKLSRYYGVTLHKGTGKWQAQAKHNDKFVNGGLHTFEEDAARKYNEMAKRIWGPFARLNRISPHRRKRLAVQLPLIDSPKPIIRTRGGRAA